MKRRWMVAWISTLVIAPGAAGVPLQFPESPVSSIEHQIHAPILIQRNRDFSHPGLISGVVSGQGSIEDPYIIADWDIIPLAGYGIRIENTTAHVVIRHNLLHDGDMRPWTVCTPSSFEPCQPWVPRIPHIGIVLRNATNVTVTSNQIEGNTQGISASGVDHLRITENMIRSNRTSSMIGRALATYDEALATVNNITWKPGPPSTPWYPSGPRLLYMLPLSPGGIKVVESGSVVIEGNTLIGFRHDSVFGYPESLAVDLQDVQWSVLRSNNVRDSSGGLITLRSNALVEHNTFDDVGGVGFFAGTIAEVRGNQFLNGSGVGVCGPETTVHVSGKGVSVFLCTPRERHAVTPCPKPKRRTSTRSQFRRTPC